VPPRSETEFRDLFRGLSPTDRRRFVGALWEARGWVTDDESDVVVARKGETVRRLRVVQPRWFGSPDVDGVDAVVTTRHRESLQHAAEAAGADYVTPADLRELLLYGVDRADASRLFTEFFDRPLSVPRDAATPDRTGWTAPTISAPSPAVLVVALIVVLAGIGMVNPSVFSFDRSASAAGVAAGGEFTPGATGALGGDEGDAGPSASTGLPPGVSEDGVENASALADAHLSNTLNRRYAFSFDFAGPAAAPDFEDWTAVEWDLVVEHRRAFRVDASFNGTGSDDWRSIGVFANGVRDYRIYRVPGSVRTNEMPAGASDADSYTYFASRVVATYLDTSNSTVTCVNRGATACQRYRIDASGETPTLTEMVGDDGTIREYRAVAHVTSDGLVTNLTVNYQYVEDGFPEAVDLRFEYDDYGTARIEPPAWLSTVRDNEERPEGWRTTATPDRNETATGTASE
jgi:hypothetical protein